MNRNFLHAKNDKLDYWENWRIGT